MPRAPYTQGGLFLYPLTTAVVTVPFAPLPVAVAGSLFFALSSGAMVYAVARHAPQLWPVFFSPAFVLAYYNIQWSPIVFAGALMPSLGWVAAAKPNIGFEAFAFRPTRIMIVGGAALLAVSFAIQPSWPIAWFMQLRMQEAPHDPPILWPLGLVGLAGLLRWRTSEGRTLAAATIAPAMSLPYDHLLLWLVPRTWREAALLTVTAWAGYLAVLATAPHDLTREPWLAQLLLAMGMYAPAAVLVLRRPTPMVSSDDLPLGQPNIQTADSHNERP